MTGPGCPMAADPAQTLCPCPQLRHEGISRLFEQGISIPEVALISGHQSRAMLRRYTNLSAQTLSEKLNAGQ